MDAKLPLELTLANVAAALARLQPYIRQTPAFDWPSAFLADHNISISVKFELWQITHTFKPRGAINVLLNTPPEQLQNGIVAQSRGNHAIAVAYAAKTLGYHAKVVIPETAPLLRRQRCEAYGAEVVLVPDMPAAFAKADEIIAQEVRLRIHPYEGIYTSQGTATIAFEWAQQAGNFDAVIIPMGGGGLISGMAAVFQQLNPNCKIYGIEAAGAPLLYEARQTNSLVRLNELNTIADSIAVPQTTPITFSLIQDYVDEIVLVSDAELKTAMRLIWEEWQLAVEPACAAATAGLLQLKEKLRDQRVGIIFCGSNMDPANWLRLTF